jgi:hypothetical protein
MHWATSVREGPLIAAGTLGPNTLGSDQVTPPSPRLTARSDVGPTTTAVLPDIAGAERPRLSDDPPGRSEKGAVCSTEYGAAGPDATAPGCVVPPWYWVHVAPATCPDAAPAITARPTTPRASTLPARADARRNAEIDLGWVKAATF